MAGLEEPHQTDKGPTGERPRQVRSTQGTANRWVRTLTSAIVSNTW